MAVGFERHECRWLRVVRRPQGSGADVPPADQTEGEPGLLRYFDNGYHYTLLDTHKKTNRKREYLRDPRGF